MKHLLVGLLIAGLLIGVLAAAQGEWTGQQWEYINVKIQIVNGDVNDGDFIVNAAGNPIPGNNMSLKAILDILGDTGWEYAGELGDQAIFKRAKP